MTFHVYQRGDTQSWTWMAVVGSQPNVQMAFKAAHEFADEKAARSDIAKARKAMVGGARLAKVKVGLP